MPTAVYLPSKFKRLIQGQRPNRNNQSSNTELLGPHPKKEASDMHTSKHFLAFFYTTYTKKVPFYTGSKIGRRFIPFPKQTPPSAPSTGSLSLVRFCCTYSKVSIKSFLFFLVPFKISPDPSQISPTSDASLLHPHPPVSHHLFYPFLGLVRSACFLLALCHFFNL